MLHFYILPGNNQKLNTHQHNQVVLLVGGYNGYYFNFGDLLQLKGAINWYKRENPNSLILPLIHLAPVPDKAFMDELFSFFETSDFVFYAFEEEDFKEKIFKLSLEPLRLPTKLPTINFHIYGGGFFNRFWGNFMLKVIEGVLNNFPVDHYVISGQQIDQKFAPILAEHFRKYQPDIIGCRDPLSIEILSKHGISAHFSSDDSFEELLEATKKLSNSQNVSDQRYSFALNLNLSYYVFLTFYQEEKPVPTQVDETLLERFDNLLNLLLSKVKNKGIPIFVDSYLTRKTEVQNMWVSIKQSLITKYFPQFIGVDLAGALLRGELNLAGSVLCFAPFFIATSYHTAFFGKMLGIPTYLMAFNEYYFQKQSGLEIKQRTLEEFLDESREIILKEQEENIKTHEEARSKWLKELKEALSVETKKAYFRVVAYCEEEIKRLQARLEEKEKIIEDLKLEVSKLKEENLLLRNQNAILSEEVFRLKERLSFIENSRSWRLVETWWKAKAHPIGRIVFFPIVKLIHLLWKK